MKVKPIGYGGVTGFHAGLTMGGLQQRGRLAYSAGYGFGTNGKTKYGETRRVGGIYQKRVYGGKIQFVKMRSYAPTNPRSTLQTAGRTKFADSIIAWANLTTAQKAVYTKTASRLGRVPRAYFISEYMKR